MKFFLVQNANSVAASLPVPTSSNTPVVELKTVALAHRIVADYLETIANFVVQSDNPGTFAARRATAKRMTAVTVSDSRDGYEVRIELGEESDRAMVTSFLKSVLKAVA